MKGVILKNRRTCLGCKAFVISSDTLYFYCSMGYNIQVQRMATNARQGELSIKLRPAQPCPKGKE